MVKSSSKTQRSRSSKVVTQSQIDKRIAQGIGQGVRESYRPWIKIRNFPSKGSSHVVPGVKIHRAHHLFSKAEYHYHVILEHDPKVIDIREQFPLHPAAETHAIACSLRYKPLFYPGGKVPFVMTTDFLITEQDENGSEKIVARTVKYLEEITELSEAKRKRLLEKLEIERVYWEKRNVDWKLVIYERLSVYRIQNLLLLRSYASITPSLVTSANISGLLNCIDKSKTSEIPLKVLMDRISKALYMKYMDVKALFFHLVWHGHLSVDFDRAKIDLAKPLTVTRATVAKPNISEGMNHG